MIARIAMLFATALTACAPVVGENAPAAATGFRLTWEDHILTIAHPDLPGGELEIWYLEAYCRPGSTDREWSQTVIGHRTERLGVADDGSSLALRCTLKDGVTVDHKIRAVADGVTFDLVAHNPTDTASLAHWAQPCIRVGAFTGTGADITDDQYAYIKKSFVFQDGDDKPDFMPTAGWAREARYTPGQVWRPRGVPADDVNPRPVNPHRPGNGLIGCVSADGEWLLATAWEPYQELFQGVIRCLHSDFRIGGLAPGETKRIRGKVYLVREEIPALLRRYRREFPAR